MAGYDELLNQATGGVAAQIAPADKYNDLLNAATGGVSAPPSSVSEGPTAPNPQHQALLDAAGNKDLADTFTAGVARGWGQLKATVPSLQAMYKEYNGDLPGAIESAKEAQDIQKPYGESDWNLQNIHSPGDFGYWLTEKMGEQGVNLATMFATGGAGGLTAKMAASQMLERGLITQSTAKGIMMGGAVAPTYAATTALETANTSQEQFEVSQAKQKADPNSPLTTAPGISLAAGMTKGALELMTPLDIGRALVMPGRQLGSTTLRGIARVTAEEGLTETAQEAVDIYARKISDPGYSYFKDGPTLWPSGWAEGMWRLAESGAAGAAVGGIYGAPFVHREQRIERQRDQYGNEPPGSKTVIQQENSQDRIASPAVFIEGKIYRGTTHAEALEKAADALGTSDVALIDKYDAPKAADTIFGGFVTTSGKFIDRATATKLAEETGQFDKDSERYKTATGIIPSLKGQLHSTFLKHGEDEVTSGIGPVSALRQLVLKPASQDATLKQSLNSDPKGDVIGITALLGDLKLQEDSKERFLDTLDANTPRYVRIHRGADRSRLMTDTEIELDRALNAPQSEKPKWLRVNQNALQPAAITAHLSDLPEATSERIWFLPNTPPEMKAQILNTYSKIQETFAKEINPNALVNAAEYNARETQGKEAYNYVLTKGLRVIPSRGAGFYYNGGIDFKGLPQEEVKSTSRSTEVGWYDPVTRKISTFTGDEATVDSEAMRRRGGNKILVAVDINRLEESNFTRHENGDIELKTAWDGSLTPGLAPNDSQFMLMQQAKGKFFNQPASTAEIDPKNIDQKTSQALKTEVDKLLPAVDRILKKIGIDGVILVHITDDVNDQGPRVWTDQGVIQFPALQKWVAMHGDISLAVHDWLMHELGHLVTYHYWRGLPVEIQDNINYAFSQAVLADRMGLPYKIGSMDLATDENRQHWSTLPEFLAEQFRRWSTTSRTARTELEKSFKDGSRKLENYYKEWEKRIGVNAVRDLSEPHYYFSAAMDFLRQDYRPAKYNLKQWEKRQTLHSINSDIQESPVLTMVGNTVISAIESLNQMIPQNLQIQIKEWVNPGISGELIDRRTWGMYNRAQGKNLDFIEMALAAMPADLDLAGGRITLVHELVHAYEERGFFLPEEISLLTKEALLHRSELISAEDLAAYRKDYRAKLELQADKARKDGVTISQQEINIKLEEGIEKELRAHYVSAFANQGIAFSDQSRTILARLMAIIEKIRNYFNNLGFQTKEDLLRAIFKGEMVHRADRVQEQARRARWVSSIQQQMALSDGINEVNANAVWQKDGMTVKAFYDSEGSKKEASQVYYHWFNGDQKVGELILENQGPKGFSIEWIESANASGMIKWNLNQGRTLQNTMLQEAERDLGFKIRLPGYFTAANFSVARLGAKVGQVDKNLLALYTPIKMDSGNTAYVSPHFLKKQVSDWAEKVAEASDDPVEHAYAVQQFKTFRNYIRQLPKNIWSDPRLDQMFSLKRNNERDEVQGSLLRSGQKADENQLNQSLGFPQDGATQDSFSANFTLKQKLSQGENARLSGLPFELSAPSSMMSLGIGRVWGWATKMEGNPFNAKDLANFRHEADRIGYFSKIWMTITQLAQVNEHIAPLQDLVQFKELMGILASRWHKIANETRMFWDSGRGPERMQSITDSLFALTEMKYRTKQEEASGVTRLPGAPGEWENFLKGVPPTPGGELSKLFKDNNLKAKDWEVIRRVQGDFQAFLKESEDTIAKKLTKKLGGSPQTLQLALAKLAASMSKFRTKPYFPLMRFGQFTLSVRENGVLKAAYAFESMRARDAVQRDVIKQNPNAEITRGTVPQHAIEFMGLPAPLLQQIKENLLDENKPGLSSEQINLIRDQKEWIENFELLHDPDRTFRKRWLPSKGMPGHSLDALRVYAHYFNSGSRYLSRLAYMDDMRQRVDMLRARAMSGRQADNTRANAIADYASRWLEYALEGGRDGGKFRSVVALWFLGFSPIAAGMNMLQPVQTAVPKMGADFGAGRAYVAWLKANVVAGKNRSFVTGDPRFDLAREEMKRQEYIDVGQGAELASFAEMNNLDKLHLGTKGQQFYRKLGSAGMFMFQATEKYAREVTMKSAWDLAIAHPELQDSKGKDTRLRQLDTIRLFELRELQTRLGFSDVEARAFVYAKETIARSQFNYGRADDAPMMRGKGKDFLIFFKFTQNMLWAFGHNGAMIHMILLTAFLFGLNGLPGAEDFNEILRWVSKKLGFTIDLQEEARKFARAITKGTIFDETGPDLVMHGISRYGFGMGAFPQWWHGPSFDASANGSMGKVIPGFADVMHGINTGKDTSKTIADGVERASGAGYGTVFAILHALNDPGSADSKKWTAALPRFLKAEYKVYRYAVNPQAETDSSGAKIVKFDPQDWQDVANIAFQALGATPTKVSETHEMLRAKEDTKAVYKMERMALLVQLQKAVESNNPDAMNDWRKAVEMYNKQVAEIDPQYVIKGNQATASIKQRLQQKAMMEATLSKTKGDIGLTQRVMDLYPGVKAERVK